MTTFRSGLLLASLRLLFATELAAQIDFGSETKPGFVLPPAVFY
jgi:hypothetical protein